MGLTTTAASESLASASAGATGRSTLGEAAPGLSTALPQRSGPRPRCRNEAAFACSNEDLIACYQDNHCQRCLDALLENNAGLVRHVLRRFSHSKEPSEDLFQVARMGLLKAAQRFDRTRGLSFGTYTVAMIDGEVRHHLRDNLLMKQPRWARGLYHHIRKAEAEYFERQQRFPTVQELALAVNVTEEGVREVLRVYAQIDMQSLDESALSGEAVAPEPDARLVRSLRYESFALPVEDRIALYEALAKLSAMHKKLIYLLFFKELSQQEVATELGVSQRTISREQSKALGRLRAILSKKIF